MLIDMGKISLHLNGTRLKKHSDHLAQSKQSVIDSNKILVIGLGQIGLPVARYVKEKGFETYGFDVNSKVVQSSETLGIRKAEKFSGFAVYVLCLPTHKSSDIFSPQIESLLSVVAKISKEGETGALISIESTIPRGTSKKVFDLLGQRFHVAHVPHRWYALEEDLHGVNQRRIAGGVCNCCLESAYQFYSGCETSKDNITSARNITSELGSIRVYGLGIPLQRVSDVEIAEISKVVENAHRYLQIAFAEDLYLYAQANNVDFSELRSALNSKWNVEVLEPRDGIGGHCLPKDTRLFLESSKIKSKLISAAMKVDENYRGYIHLKSKKCSIEILGT